MCLETFFLGVRAAGRYRWIRRWTYSNYFFSGKIQNSCEIDILFFGRTISWSAADAARVNKDMGGGGGRMLNFWTTPAQEGGGARTRKVPLLSSKTGCRGRFLMKNNIPGT